MKFADFIANVFRPVRLLIVASVCCLLFLVNILPAAAIGSSPSNPSEGATRLDEIYRKSEEVTKADPLSMEETQREANRGVNEIQGAADIHQMNRPENSGQATAVEEQVKRVLEKVKGED